MNWTIFYSGYAAAGMLTAALGIRNLMDPENCDVWTEEGLETRFEKDIAMLTALALWLFLPYLCWYCWIFGQEEDGEAV